MIVWDDTALHRMISGRLNETARKLYEGAVRNAAGRFPVTITEATGDNLEATVGTDAAGFTAEYGSPEKPPENWMMNAVREAQR